jgi:hypothetical protein
MTLAQDWLSEEQEAIAIDPQRKMNPMSSSQSRSCGENGRSGFSASFRMALCD